MELKQRCRWVQVSEKPWKSDEGTRCQITHFFLPCCLGGAVDGPDGCYCAELDDLPLAPRETIRRLRMEVQNLNEQLEDRSYSGPPFSLDTMRCRYLDGIRSYDRVKKRNQELRRENNRLRIKNRMLLRQLEENGLQPRTGSGIKKP